MSMVAVSDVRNLEKSHILTSLSKLEVIWLSRSSFHYLTKYNVEFRSFFAGE